MSYMTLMVPHTLYGIGIVWPPHVCMVPLHVQYDVSDSYGPPHTLYEIGI